MTAPLPLATWLAALLDGGLTEFISLAVKVLTVAGGVLVGWFAGAPIARVLVRLAFHKEAPHTAQTVARFGSAFLVGYLVYLIPLSLGGSGEFGWGGGTGSNKGKGADGGETASKDARKKKKIDPREDETDHDRKKVEPVQPDVLLIRVLGGKAVKGDRFYQIKIAGKDTALSEDKVRKYLLKEKKRIARVNILLDSESADEATVVVRDLVNLCKEYISSVRVIKEK
jgi:hypothetical protein